MPVSSDETLSLKEIAEWWSRWQKVTPGEVHESPSELLNKLIYAFWCDKLIIEPIKAYTENEVGAFKEITVRVGRLEVLQMLFSEATRADTVLIPLPDDDSGTWTEASCQYAFVFMAEYWKNADSYSGSLPRLEREMENLAHTIHLSRQTFLCWCKERGYSLPTFWGSRQAADATLTSAPAGAARIMKRANVTETVNTKIPSQPTSVDGVAGSEPKRSRKRGKRTRPQQLRARKVLRNIWPDGNYPSREDLSDEDLLKRFNREYLEMLQSEKLLRSVHGKPSPSSVLREVGRKD
jgi:hypothetical protein